MKSRFVNTLLVFFSIGISVVFLLCSHLTWVYFSLESDEIEMSKLRHREPIRLVSELKGDFPYNNEYTLKISSKSTNSWRFGFCRVNDLKLGLGSLANCNKRVQVRTKKGELIYDTIYQFDKYGRRKYLGARGEHSKFLVLFGGSFVMGVGLPENETLASKLSFKLRNYKIYDYSREGYGTNHMLVQLQFKQINYEMSEPTGIAYYVFMHDHIARSLGDSSWMTMNTHAPWYDSKNIDVNYRGTFFNKRWTLSKLYKTLGKSVLAEKFNFRYPPLSWESSVKLACQITLRAKKEFLKKFPNSEFKVVIHPMEQESKKYQKINSLYINCLTSHSLEVLKPKYPKGKSSTYKIPVDGHPNVKANDFLSNYLAKDAGS